MQIYNQVHLPKVEITCKLNKWTNERTNAQKKMRRTKQTRKTRSGAQITETLLRSKRVQNHQNQSYAALFLATSKFAVFRDGVLKSINRETQ